MTKIISRIEIDYEVIKAFMSNYTDTLYFSFDRYLDSIYKYNRFHDNESKIETTSSNVFFQFNTLNNVTFSRAETSVEINMGENSIDYIFWYGNDGHHLVESQIYEHTNISINQFEILQLSFF